MATTLNLIITDAGIQEVINAQHDGTAPVVLSQVGVGRGIYTPVASQTALHDEIKRLGSIAGGVVGGNIMHIQALDGDAAAAYAVYEVGVYTASGTLFAVYSQALPILHKVADSEIMLAIDIILTGVEPTAVTVGDTNYTLAPATTSNMGVVELATNEETVAGTDTERAVTPAGLAAVTAPHANLFATSRVMGHFRFVQGDDYAFMAKDVGTANQRHTLNDVYMRSMYFTLADAQSIGATKSFSSLIAITAGIKHVTPIVATITELRQKGSTTQPTMKAALQSILGMSESVAASASNAIKHGGNYITTDALTSAQISSLSQSFTVTQDSTAANVGASNLPFDAAYIKNIHVATSVEFYYGSTIEYENGATVDAGALYYGSGNARDVSGELHLDRLDGSTDSIYIAEAAMHAAADTSDSSKAVCPVGSIVFAMLSQDIKGANVSVEVGEVFSVSANQAFVANLKAQGFTLDGSERKLPAGKYKAFHKITFNGATGSTFAEPVLIQRVE